MSQKRTGATESTSAAERRQRLAEQLRSNLLKRKVLSRAKARREETKDEPTGQTG